MVDYKLGDKSARSVKLTTHLHIVSGVARVGRVVRPPRAAESEGRQNECFM